MRTIFILMSLLFHPFLVNGQPSDVQVIDRIVAVVDDEIILKTHLEFSAQEVARQEKIDLRTEPAKYEELLKKCTN